MAYRSRLQADALKLVAQRPQSSLAVEGELPDDGLAGYGDTGDDVMMALARKLASGDAEDEPFGNVFGRTQPEPVLVAALWSGAELAGAALVPSGRHHSSEPREPATLFSWSEFLTEVDEQPKSGSRHAPQTGPSLFDWALEREWQVGLVAAGG